MTVLKLPNEGQLEIDEDDVYQEDNDYCENFATKCDCKECINVPDSVKRKRFEKGVMCLIGSFLINIFLGCLYLWGSISGYYISYLHYNGQPNISSSDTLAVIPISWVISSSFSPLGTVLLRKWNVKVLMATGSFICIMAVVMASRVNNFSHFLFFYSIMLPFGNALIGFPSTMVCWEHFPNKKGLVSGFISMGFGLGAFFFGFLASAAVSTPN